MRQRIINGLLWLAEWVAGDKKQTQDWPHKGLNYHTATDAVIQQSDKGKISFFQILLSKLNTADKLALSKIVQANLRNNESQKDIGFRSRAKNRRTIPSEY
jgi:hypothetical protein